MLCNCAWVRRGRDHMVAGFSTIYTISAYHHWCCEIESRSGRCVQHYVIKFVSDLRQVIFSGSSTNKTDQHDITKILLKVALNTTKQTIYMYLSLLRFINALRYSNLMKNNSIYDSTREWSQDGDHTDDIWYVSNRYHESLKGNTTKLDDIHNYIEGQFKSQSSSIDRCLLLQHQCVIVVCFVDISPY